MKWDILGSARKTDDVPERFTGGVDYTDAEDITNADSEADTLAGLNAQPDVIQTLTGIGPLSPDVHLEIPHDDGEPYEQDPALKHGFAELRSQWDGTPVRPIPASRTRTQRFALGPNTSVQVLMRDARRRRTVVIATSANASDKCYISNDLSNVPLMGFPLPLNVPFEITSADELAVATDPANNVAGLTFAVFTEIAE